MEKILVDYFVPLVRFEQAQGVMDRGALDSAREEKPLCPQQVSYRRGVCDSAQGEVG